MKKPETPFDTNEFKASFHDKVMELSKNYSKENLLKMAMVSYAKIELKDETEKMLAQIENFGRILAGSSKVTSIGDVGLYVLMYSQPNEMFTFVDTFPLIYIFNPKDIVNHTIAGVNLNRIDKPSVFRYVKSQIGMDEKEVKRTMEYEILNRYGAENTPFRRYKMSGILKAWKIPLHSLQYYDLSWMASFLK